MTNDHDAQASLFDARLEGVADGTIPDDDLTADEIQLRHLMVGASGPVLPEEMLGKELVLTAFGAQGAEASARAAGISWIMKDRRKRAGRRTCAVAAGVVAAVLLSGAAAAAATGSLPAPLQQVAHRVLGAPDADGLTESSEVAGDDNGPAADPTTGPTSNDQDPSTAVSPSPPVHASGTPAAGSVGGSASGLCRAWTAHDGSVNPNSALARSLGSLAGGTTQVAAYCEVILASPHGHSGSVKANGSDTDHGKPAETGGGKGKAKGNSSDSSAPSASSHPSKPGQAKDKPSTPSKGGQGGQGSDNGKGSSKGHPQA